MAVIGSQSKSPLNDKALYASAGASSPHFSSAELACKHCGVNACLPELLDALEQLRAVIGKPIIVNDAYRCAEHNAAVGGVPDSEHVQGIGADISVLGMTGAELEAAAQACPLIKGIGRSDSPAYVHIDTRPAPARWAYDARGKWCDWYPAAVA